MDNHTESVHQPALFAEPIFHIGSFPVTNSLINSVTTVLILVAVFWLVGRKMKKVPKGLQNLFEMMLEGALTFSDSITDDRKKSEKFLPLILGLFLFILVNNYLGLIPGVGTIGFHQDHEGHSVFVPLFRGATADLNTTLALGLVTIFLTHFFAVIAVGVWTYINRYINIKAILEIPQKFSEDKSVLLVNPIKVFVSLIEIISELARIVSLSFRLFGNIFAGEVLIASMMAISAFLLPIPFIFMEFMVGIIQAVVFSVLILAFLSISTSAEEH